MATTRSENELGKDISYGFIFSKLGAQIAPSEMDQSCIVSLMRNDFHTILMVERMNKYKDVTMAAGAAEKNENTIEAYDFLPETKGDEITDSTLFFKNLNNVGKVRQRIADHLKSVDWQQMWEMFKLKDSNKEPDESLFWKISMEDYKKLKNELEKDLKNPPAFKSIGATRFSGKEETEKENSYTWAKKKLNTIGLNVEVAQTAVSEAMLSGIKLIDQELNVAPKVTDSQPSDSSKKGGGREGVNLRFQILQPDEYNDKCVLSLMRNDKHALLVIEGVEKIQDSPQPTPGDNEEKQGISCLSTSHWIEVYDFLPMTAVSAGLMGILKNPSVEGRIKQRERQHAEDIGWEKIWEIFKFKDSGEDLGEYKYWKISKDDYRRLRDDINKDMTCPPSFKISGADRVQKSSDSTKQHNCFTWAREKLENIGIFEEKFQPTFLSRNFVADPSKFIQAKKGCTIL